MRQELGSPFGPDDPVPDTRRVEDYVERLDPRVFFVKGMFIEPLRKQLDPRSRPRWPTATSSR